MDWIGTDPSTTHSYQIDLGGFWMTFIASLQRELANFGFVRVGRRDLFVARYGDVLHVVSARKSRVDATTAARIGVWQSALSDATQSFEDQLQTTPFGGDVSPSGVERTWWWNTNQDAGQLLCRAVVEYGLPFLATIGSPKDLQECVEDIQPSETVKERLSFLVSGGAAVLERSDIPGAQYHGLVEIRRFDAAIFRETVGRALHGTMRALGFEPKMTERQQLYMRQRSELTDVLEVCRSMCGAFTSLRCFVFSPTVWKARRELKGLYPATNGGYVGEEGINRGLCALPTSSLAEARTVELLQRRVLDEALPQLEKITNLRQFVDSIGNGWDILKTSMAHLG